MKNYLFHCKRMPFYGDIICRKIKLNGSTFIVGLALPDGIDVSCPCYYLYKYDIKSPGCYSQIVGHPDINYIFQYLVRHFI